MRGEAFTRQLRLLQLLETRRQGLELEEAAEELGTGRRTVYRDLRILEDAGIPLTSEVEGRRARWRMMEGHRHRLQLSLTWSEMLALSVGSRLLEGLSGTLLHTSAVSALEKVRATFPKAVSDRVRGHESQVSVEAGGRDYASRDAVVRLLVEAIAEHQTLEVEYHSRTAQSAQREPRRIDPVHLRVSNQGLYVVGRCHRTQELRTFLVDRFQAARRTGVHFEPAEDRDPLRMLSTAFAMWSGPPRRVRVVVAPPHAELLMERKVHPSQVAQRRHDGNAEVSLSVALGPPLVSWLVGLGPALVELEPAALQRQVRRSHEEALRRLGAPQGARPGRTQGRPARAEGPR